MTAIQFTKQIINNRTQTNQATTAAGTTTTTIPFPENGRTCQGRTRVGWSDTNYHYHDVQATSTTTTATETATADAWTHEL